MIDILRKKIKYKYQKSCYKKQTSEIILIPLAMSEAKPSRRRKLYNEFLKESAIHGVRLLIYYTPFKYAR